MSLRSHRNATENSDNKKSICRRSNSVPKSYKFEMNKGFPEARVVLDEAFVQNYLRQQEKSDVDDILDISMISLHSDSSDDPDKSVQFVSEDRATHEIKQIGKMNHGMAELRERCKKLEVHVGALQNRVIQLQNEATTQSEVMDDNHSTNATNETSFEVIAVAESHDLSADLQLNESFVNNQLLEWKENGELNQVLDEFSAFLNENI